MCPVQFKEALQRTDQRGKGKRLGEEQRSAIMIRLIDVRLVAGCGEDHYRYVFQVTGLQFLQALEAIAPRHIQVQEDEVWLQPGELGRVLVALLQKANGNGRIHFFEGFAKQGEIIFVIVNEENAVDGLFWWQHTSVFIGFGLGFRRLTGRIVGEYGGYFKDKTYLYTLQ